MDGQTLIRLRPRPNTIYVSSGRTVLATGTDGSLDGKTDHGMYVCETRLLSKYRYRIDGVPLYPVSTSHVTQSSWLGYYIAPAPLSGEADAEAATTINAAAQHAIELRLFRALGKGMHEHVDLTNFTQSPVTFTLVLELGCDFADLAETRGKRQQFGNTKYSWSEQGQSCAWSAEYEARHRYSHGEETGEARLKRGISVRFSNAGSAPRHDESRISFEVSLAPHASWHCCVDFVPVVEGKELRPAGCNNHSMDERAADRRTESFLSSATCFSSAHTGSLSHVVVGALERGKHDLAALRLFDLDRNKGAWTVAAGLPLYVALFGRDTLTASWEAAPVSLDLMRGTLAVLPEYQGRWKDDWRDEEPGRMLHESHTGPLSVLNYQPRGRDYGSITTSGFYPFVLAQLWHWTGDKSLVAPYVEPALAAIRWLNEYSRDPDGFTRYKTHSEQGVENQGWKDSGDAIVYEDGSQVPKPIATCEEQGIKYAAQMNFAEVLWYLDRRDEAKAMYRQARELKKRFNDAFWMEDEGFFAMALDPDRRQVRSIGSNALHCIATGIADRSLIARTFERLFQRDMFSGWGVRTLSSDHPAYSPYAYHRGTVWPVEHGPFAVGAYRYGYHDRVERIARAQFELAALLDFYRLPECIAGHQRDEHHPFPPLYPAANSPQAWSATTVYTLLQAILGMQPFAPLRILFLDPHLPAWLPELTISGMRVAGATVSLRFFHTANGRSDYEIVELRGKLRVVRQPSPWSFTATFGERVADLVASALH